VTRSEPSSATAIDTVSVLRPLFHHLLLKTTRRDELKEWYRTVLGMEVRFEDDVVCFLYNDEANHRVVLLTTPKLTDDPDKFAHSGLDHFACEYKTLEDLLGTFVRLKNRGIEPFLCLDHGLTTSFYYSDPDGNGLELQVDNFGDWAASSEFMRTDPGFAKNPIGAHVDPEQLIAAVEAGTTRDEIRQRSWAGGYPPANPGAPRIPM
jgi:catechol 2,3-dioxygenase